MADSETSGGEARWRLDRRALGAFRSFRFFATPPDAPRSRRPTDAVLLGLGLAAVAAASWAGEPAGRLSNDLVRLAEGSPGWMQSIWQVLFDFMPFWAVVLVLMSILRRFFVLAASQVVAAALSIAVAYASQEVALADPLGLEDFVRALTRSGDPLGFPGIRLAVTTAVLVVASPGLSRPFRFFGRIVLTLGFLATVGLSASTFVGAVGGLAAGVVAAAAVHLAFGSPGGRPSRTEAKLALAELGVPVRDVEPALIQPAGVVLMTATHLDGRELEAKLYGRDAWDSQLIAKLWRWAWYRNSQSTVLLSRLHQVEHEALLTVLAGRAGTPVPEVLVAGATSTGDASLVSTVGGAPLSSVLADGAGGTDGPDLDAFLVESWASLGRSHAVGIVHGEVSLSRLTVDTDGTPVLIDWSAASAAAPPEAIDLERAQFLIVTALVLGSARAVSLARATIGADEFGDVIPYLQMPALSNETRHEVKELDFDLDELRHLATEAAGVDEVELVRLRRVTLKSVLSMGVVALAAMLLISSLSDVGLDTIVDELSMATWGWVVAALVVAQCARIFTAVGTTGATVHPLRLGPTVVLEFAITFVNLVIPSTAARIATKMRYFQKAGMTLPAATAMGAIDSLAGFGVQLTILASAFFFGVGGVDFTFDFNADSVERLVTLIAVVVAVLVVVLVGALIVVPRVRERAKRIFGQFREALAVVRSPERLLRLFGGNLTAEIVFASVLGLCLLAYGERAPIMSLLVINVGVALLAGLMPVPGGVGVSEAGLTAGLVAIGIPEATAFAAAITTRMCTFYLPPIWGYFAMRWLRKNEYL
jgi:uncharacterized membrane protein YbhN (UPF0104 family)/tRNA A-37 threonylcarbamoyl transferase component Bud32